MPIISSRIISDKKLSLFFSIERSIDEIVKAETCNIAMKPIPIITKATNDSTIEIPLFDLSSPRKNPEIGGGFLMGGVLNYICAVMAKNQRYWL